MAIQMVSQFLTSYLLMLISKVTTTLRLIQVQLCNLIQWYFLQYPYIYTLFDDQFLMNPEITLRSCIICYLFYSIRSSAPKTLQIITILIGLLFQLQSQDLIITFVCFELINISLALIICTYSSGIKYILTSQVLTTFFILGIVLVYAVNGHTSLSLFNYPLLLVFQFKLGILPFHQLTADLYDGLTTKTMMIIQLPIKLGIFLFQIDNFSYSGDQTIKQASFAAIMIPAISTQHIVLTLKRFQALSSISYQTLLFIIVCSSTVKFAVTSYAIIYIITLSLIMIAFLAPHPLIVTTLFQSIAGLPPFLGFYLKLYQINDLLQGDSTWLVIIFLSSSLIQTANYLERSASILLTASTAPTVSTSLLTGLILFWSVY